MKDHPYEYRLFKFYVDVEALFIDLKKTYKRYGI